MRCALTRPRVADRYFSAAVCKATARWDDPTGIGTPDGAKLAAPGGRPGNGTSTGSRTIGGGSDTTDTDSGSSGGCNAGGGMVGSGSLIVIGLAAIVVALAAG